MFSKQILIGRKKLVQWKYNCRLYIYTIIISRIRFSSNMLENSIKMYVHHLYDYVFLWPLGSIISSRGYDLLQFTHSYIILVDTFKYQIRLLINLYRKNAIQLKQSLKKHSALSYLPNVLCLVIKNIFTVQNI